MTDVRRPAVAVAAAVDDVLPLIGRCAAETRERGRLPTAVDDALRATGINRMLMPAGLGGYEAPTPEVVDVLERIAAVDGSTAWCATIGAGSNLMAGYLPEAGARRIFADPDCPTATMFAPLGTLDDDGSLHLDGRWPFVSGCLHASWIGLGAKRRRGGEVDPKPWIAFVPADGVTIEDTWDVVGLRGTGSHHVAVARVAVDPSHCCEFVGAPWADGPLWRLPLFSVVLPMLAAVPLGVARGALEEVARQVRDARGGVRRGDLGGDPVAMADYAAAVLRVDAARRLLLDLVDEAHQAAARGDAIDRRLLARIYLADLHAVDTAVEATAVAHRLGGGSATYADSRLLHALNDVHAARQHFQFAHEHRVALGLVLAGRDDTYPPYIT